MPQQFVIQGRIVFGHPIKPRQKKDVRTRQPIIKDGQPVQQYVFGIAIEKNAFYNQPIQPQNASAYQMLQHEARTAFPNGVPQNFSFKFKDGDSIDAKGQPYSTREGYAGHVVLTVSTEGFAPTVYKHENGSYRQLQEHELKCGDFVAVNITAKYNGAVSPNTPGLYINPNGIVLIGYGQEIVSAGADPDELFAGMQPQQFAGMTTQPMLQHGAAAPGMAPQQPQLAAPAQYGAAPQPQYAAAPQPGMMPAAPAPAQLPPPAHDFVNNAMGAAPGMAPQQPQYAPAPQQFAGQPGAMPAQPMAPAQYAPAPANPAMGYPSNPPQQPQYAAPGQPGMMPGMPQGR